MALDDEGDVDMRCAMLTYKKVGYDHILTPDHVPTMPVGGEGEYGYNLGAARRNDGNLEAFAFARGHISGLIQAAVHTA